MLEPSAIAGSTLRLGILDLCPLPGGMTARDALFDSLEQAVHVEELGYTRYWLAEHHGRGTAHSSPEILAGLIAQVTRTIRVGTAGILLSYYSPLKVAKDFRLLNEFFPGRIDLGVGAGRVDEATARGLLGDHSGEPNYGGKVRDLVAYVSQEKPPPLFHSEGTPEVWVLGSGGAGSADLAARHGTAFGLSLFLAGSTANPEVVQAYRNRFQPSRALARPKWNVAVAGICGDTDEAAERLAAQHQNRFLVPTVIGSPRRCRDQLLDIARRYETDEIIFLAAAGTRTQRLRGFQLLAEALKLPPGPSEAQGTAVALATSGN